MTQRRYWFPKSYADTVAKLRVPAGFVLVIAFAIMAEPSGRSLAIGIPVAALGLLLRGWAAGHLSKNEVLATSGPYAYVRNPLYVGTLLVAVGLAIAAQRWALGILFVSTFLLIYLPVMELEEQHLRRLFPQYEEYGRRVPLLIPRGKRIGAVERFQRRLYFRNEEYQATLGFLAGVIFLLWKSTW